MSFESVTALPLVVRITWIDSDGTPSVRVMPFTATGPSVTVATSPRSTGALDARALCAAWSAGCPATGCEADDVTPAWVADGPVPACGAAEPTMSRFRSSTDLTLPRTSTGTVRSA